MIFFNDKEIYNVRYRSDLMNFFIKNNCQVRSVGVFENISSFFFSILYFRNFFVVSNLRSNLLFLVSHPFSKKMVIVNGLGRFRLNHWFRVLFVWLLNFNVGIFIIQNYADFRFFRRFVNKSCSDRLYFVPGSGGFPRRVCSEESVFLVSRLGKLSVQKSSIENFHAEVGCEEITCVGITDIDPHFFAKGLNFDCVGYVSQDKLFSFGNTILIPSGYGEGFPHVLADAFCSSLNIWIERRVLRLYGIDRMDYKVLDRTDHWVLIRPSYRGMKRFSVETVSASYFTCYEEMCNAS